MGRLIVLCLLLVLAVVVSHRHLVECAGGQEAAQLLINWPSSDLFEGTVLHTFLASPNQLLTDPLDCPADTFTLGGPGHMNLLLLRNITFEEPTENPMCVRNADSATIGFTSIKTYKCVVTLNDMTTSMPITVNVQPEFHNTRLTFQRTFYSGWVVEGLANTTVSLTTAGITPQTEPRAGLFVPQYRVTGEFSHLFRVRQQQTGCTAAPVVETAEPLDRETQSYYQVTLEAYALHAPSLISTSTSLGIHILDANDNPPEFVGSPPDLLRLMVPVGKEHVLSGTRIAQYNVADADLGINGETLFSVPNETTTNLFTIHPLNGWVYSFAPVEPGSSVVSIWAQDYGEPTQFASPRSLSVFIDHSANITRPQIHIHGLGQSSMQQHGIVTISELASTGDPVTIVEVMDPAAEDLSLTATNIGSCECFALSSSTPIPDGVRYTLLVAETLDFESTPSGQYLVVLSATNTRSSGLPLTSTLELRVEVTDDNEPPQFTGLGSRIKVTEGVPVGTKIGRALASDPDGDTNGMLTYSISDSIPPGGSLFEIDSSSGLLRTLAELDAESLVSAQVTVTVVDGGGLNSTAVLNVSIVDRNDNPPSLLTPSSGEGHVTIPEDHPWDEPIFQFVAVDADSGCNGALEYSILHADPGAFHLDPSSGLLYPSGPSALDYESFEAAILVVKVTDLGVAVNFSIEATLHVSLTDVNDEVPVLDPIGCPCFIGENLQPSSPEASCPPLSAHDRDSTELAFEILAGNSGLFQINRTTGIVTITAPLDREVLSHHTLGIAVSDGTHQSPQMQLSVVVVGANDHSLVFGGPYLFTVPETTRGLVGAIQVMDSNGDSNVNSFCIASGNLRGSFEISEMGGEIVARNGLDYENLPPEFNLTVVAYNSTLNPAFGTTMVRIVIQDVNEPPVFSMLAYRASVSEGTVPGTAVINVTAMDRDAMENGEVSYAIPSGVPFTVGAQSGIIMTSGVLTQQNHAVITFNVTASDSGTPRLSSEAEVQITLTDINDITPVFNTLSTVTVAEDTAVGSEILLLNATDGDIGVNGLLLFTLVSGDATSRFSLDPWSGSLIVAQPLNSGDSPYTLELRVQDLGSPQHSSTPFHLTVMVTDSNDHFPVFSSAEYECRIPERGAFTETCQVSATDMDRIGTQVSFSLVGSSPFTINANSGVISTATSGATLLTLDREEEPAYVLQVVATDTHPAGSKTSTAIVRVVVVDSNDAPNTRSDRFLFYEGTPLNTLMFYAHVHDPDTPTNFSLVTYGVISGGNAFRVDDQTGAVFLGMELDSAIMTEPLTLQIIGTNSQHSTPTSATSTYTIEVASRNNNALPPVFHLQSNPSGVWISRATSPGMHVVTLNATDPEMQALRYDIMGGTGAGYFQIEPNSGEVTTAFPLTAVEGSELTLQVRVRDSIVYPLPAWHELTITLSSEASLKPFFDRPVFSVNPFEGSSGVVAAVRASVDGQVDTSICYSIQGGNGNQLFSIDRQTGAISMSGAGDRETQALHILTVRAEIIDIAETSTALVVVDLEDENDFRPLIVESRFDFTVFENFPVGAGETIVKIFAEDSDAGENRRLTYSITSPMNSPFGISPDTGDLYLVRPLNRTEASMYFITVSASDNSSFPSIGMRTLTIMVEPPLASSPAPILNAIPTIVVSENGRPGDLLTQVNLTASFNGPLIYRIVERQSVVSILPNSGEVYLVEPVDFEEHTQLSYTVEVLDGITVTPIRTPLVIAITNVNDNRPMFDQRVYKFNIREDIAAPVAGFPIQRVVATDRDNGDVLIYSLVESLHPSSFSLFTMNPSNGLISLSNQATPSSIDREVLPIHTLTVAVRDNGTTPLMDYARVVITIQDSNDHAPQFMPSDAEVYVLESSLSQGEMHTVKAFDPDGGANAQISYTLVTTDTPFTINSTTGVLSLTPPLTPPQDGELQLVYTLEVTAFNPNNPTVFSTPNLNLTVQVIPELDSVPVLMAPPTSSVRENYPPYSEVDSVQSPDSDRQVYYSIVAGNDHGHFLVEPMTGIVRTTTPLDREAVASYQLVLQGSFRAGFEANTTLSISVTDQNDNSPAFSAPFLRVQIPENSPTGQSLANVSVFDTDEGENGMIRAILILDNFAASVFSIDNSGSIFLQESDQGLDREGRFSSLRFPIYAIDSGVPTHFSTAELQIDITDENEPPFFSEAAYTFALGTPVLPGIPQFRVQALDADAGTNGNITYSISGDGSEKFSIDRATGEVSVTDIYMLGEQYSLTVGARDGGGATAAVSVRILVRPCDFRNLTFGPRSSMISVEVSEGVNTNTVIVNGSDLQIIDLQEEVANVMFSLPVENSNFGISSQTGDVFVSLRLDREEISEHRLVIQATDMSDASRVAQTQVMVTVLDENDNAPLFIPSVYSFSAVATDESFMGQVLATDADEGINAEVMYSLGSNPSDFFSIHPTFGFLSFSPSNVRQLGTEVQLEITATDRGADPLSTNAAVFINIVDPSAPMFVQGVYPLTIPENTPTGTVLVNTSLTDPSQSRSISYRIESTELELSGTSLPFSVSANGSILLVDPGVDFEVESQRSYDLRIVARNDMNGLVGFALLTVDVMDSNDNAPVFEPSSTYRVSPIENTTRGSIILRVRATDADSAPNAVITYQLHSDAPSLLTISNSSSGEILLGGEFDYEQSMSYEFEVLAVDSGSPSLTSSAMVFLNVMNINDNPPVFREQVYNTFVRDNSQPGPTNLFVSASDPDNLEGLVYDIVPGPGSGDFSVSDNGRINLEIANPMEVSYTLNVSAFDGLFYGYTIVRISVEGINENSPEFNDSSYAATVIEAPPEGTVVVQVFATDDDRGTNGQVTYDLHQSESCPLCFSINATTGVISTTMQAATAIDRELTPTLTILAIAMDGGSLSTIAEVIVTVGDKNDNPPVFNIPEYFGSLVTGAPRDTEVLTVMAFDPDIDNNSRITYSIPDRGDQLIFVIHPASGVITNIFEPDNTIENGTLYVFDVSASDNGDPPVTSAATTRVTIEIVDSEQPSFEQEEYSVNVSENARVGTTVLEPRVNLNTTRACTLGLSLVVIDNEMLFEASDNAVVTASTRLIPMTSHQIFIRRTCLLLDLNFMTTYLNAIVNIFVLEVNDPPVFVGVDPSFGFYLGVIRENEIGNVNVTPPIMAIDRDTGRDGEVQYRLLNNQDKFDIVSNGLLFTIAPLDFEEPENRVIMVAVEAYDGGESAQSSSITVIVRVTDVNDNPPVFDQESYSVSVAEDATLNSLLYTAQVTDLDVDSTHTYSISGSFFIIGEHSGEVRLALALDRETQATHTVQIVASDGLHSTSADLVVTVLDSNDERPIFNDTSYEESLHENYPTGVTFIQVFATDADEGENAIIVYQQLPLAFDDNINVDNVTGEISFLVSPDYEANPQLSFSIQATDIFGELMSVVSVVVRLSDENDNAPLFGSSHYTAHILENMPSGTTVRIDLAERVIATDADSGNNSRISYCLEGEGATNFMISNGDIISRRSFDRELTTEQVFEIVVVATDMGSPALTSNASVLICVGDENDNSPFFPELVYTRNITESTPVGTRIFNASAIDLDSESTLFYDIAGENSMDFTDTTESMELVISIANNLDHENELRRQYQLILMATDGFNQGIATLIVNVLDSNDNVPQFNQSSYSATTAEDAAANTTLVTVTAMDRDNNNQALIFYSIRLAGNYPELCIDMLTGRIFVGTSLDFETRWNYNLTVVATDADPDSDRIHEDTANVIINVTDINDNPPIFTPHSSSFELPENNESGVIFCFNSTDVDTVPLNGTRTYRISGGNVGGAFHISSMGKLSVLRPLDREEVEVYHLTITVNDSALTDSTNITVRILDENDNSPTGGHQEIYLYLLNGRAPEIPLGTVFVNDSDSDAVNEHVYNLLPSSGAENIVIASSGSINIGSTPTVGTYSFTVSISERGNSPANTTINARIRDVTEATLFSSFRMQFLSITPQQFVDAHFGSFLSRATTALNRQLSTGVDLQVLSIQSSTFPSARNTDVTLAVQNLTDRTYISPLLVQHILHTHRTEVEGGLGLAISTVSVDLCSVERCSLGSTCTNSYEDSLNTASLGSRSITYLGIAISNTNSCVGTSSMLCSAVSCPGPSTCVMARGGRGEVEARCFQDCSSDPCKNGGECIDQNPGYFCQCPSGYNGRNCEVTVASFTADSYAIFSTVTSRSFGSVSLEFRASNLADSQQLLYSGRFDDTASDFLSIDIVEGSACLMYSHGGGSPRMCVQSWSALGGGDDIWHSLTVDYNQTVSDEYSMLGTRLVMESTQQGWEESEPQLWKFF